MKTTLFFAVWKANLRNLWWRSIALAVCCTIPSLAHSQNLPPATPGKANVTVNGWGQCVYQNGVTQCDYGELFITVNGFSDTVPYGGDGVSPGSYARQLAATINSNNPYVTASVSSAYNVITLTAKTAGANTNYPISVGSYSNAYDNCSSDGSWADYVPCFPTPSVSLTASGSTLTGGADAPTPVPGFINPKYVILSWMYAPPGSRSSVSYNNSQLVGTSNSVSNSFSNTVGVSITADDIAMGVGTGASGTASTSYTQEFDTSSSVSLSQTKTFVTTVPGPANDSVGVNHDYDVVCLWLNPLVNFTVYQGFPNATTWTGFSYDASDIPEMDIFCAQMGYLDGNFPMRADIAQVLARTWAAGQAWPTSEGPGLTGPGAGTDFEKIVAANPFSNPAYTLTVPQGSLTSSDGRYTITANQNINYVPPGAGGSPATQGYTANYQKTEMEGEGAKYTTQIMFTMDDKFKTPFGLNLDVKQSNTLTWTSQWSTTRTNTQGQTAALSITGPTAASNYTGPTEFLVFQDNIYGTFMFYPVSH